MKQYILDMEAQLRSIENQMKSADDTALETLMKKYSDLNHEFEIKQRLRLQKRDNWCS